MISDTIVSPATPPGYGGISIVRLSGINAKKIATSMSRGCNNFKTRVATFVSIFDNDDEKIDDVLITFFKSPRSYTGENVIEFSCHGNPIIVDQIVATACDAGARIAEPGEFTKRAFLNGKLDLLQAESVASLIQSQSNIASKINNKVLSGELSNKLIDIKNKILGVMAELEFEFDIRESELIRPNLINNAIEIVEDSVKSLNVLIGSYKEGRMYNQGARVIIAGKPNVGKSTLLNALLNKDRAITDSAPGTTRDTIHDNIILEGIPITFVDTAGIRNTNNPVESAGVKRSLLEIKNADLLINMTSENEYLIDNIDDIDTITVYNKSDLGSPSNIHKNTFLVSALYKNGIKSLKKAIIKKLTANNSSGSNTVLTTRRQLDAITICSLSLKRSHQLLKKELPELELVSFELRDAINHLDVLFGKTTTNDLLKRVFSGFCVGK